MTETQDVVITGYLQQQAIMIYSLQLMVQANSAGGEAGLVFNHKSDENTAIASIALSIAMIHATLGL